MGELIYNARMKSHRKESALVPVLAAFAAVLFVVAVPVMASDVMDLLQGYEWEVPKGPVPVKNAEEELIRIASDSSQPNFIRARAAAALTVYPNDRVWEFYRAQITSSPVASAVRKVSRRRAIDALCTAFLPERSQAIQELIIPLLTEGDAHLRVRVAQCLLRIDSDAAKSALGNYRAGIGESWELKAAQGVR
jgi:hypothetical protein